MVQYSLWDPATQPTPVTDPDRAAVQLGVKFQANTNGAITGLRFYKAPENTGTHVGNLWSTSGANLATATFMNETASGWQQVNFASPVAIAAGTTYVASYHAPNGRYSVGENYFTQARTNGPLTALASGGETAGNGVYRYGAFTVFPSQTYEASNYWVDVVFEPASTSTNTPPVASNDSAATNEDTVLRLAPASLLANDSDADGDALSIASVGGASNGSVALSASEVVFTPQANYNGPASFTYTLSDGKGGSATAAVAVTVAAVNDAPLASADSGFTTPAGTALTIPAASLLGNDSDVDNSNSALSIASIGGASNGSVVLDAQKNPVFTPNAGYSGPASFTYTATDGAATSNPATVSLTVGTIAQPSNPIAAENARPGNPRSEWDLNNGASSNIEGYAAQFSVDQGQTVDFKINTNSANYRVDIYRLGYYGGSGARKVATLTRSGAQPQPSPLRDSSTGLVDAGNWAVSASWAVPADAVSGVYIAKLVRQDGTPGENHVPFIVRDDDGRSDVIVQTADTTWQAYNEWGGNSLYTGSPAGRAYKVSYNRPFTTREGGASTGPRDFLFDSEYPTIRWLEANG